MNKNNNNSFARTCSRLSQFLKERRSLGDQSCFPFSHMAPPPPPSSKRAEEEFGTKKGKVSPFAKNSEREGHVSGVPGQNLKSLSLFPLTNPSTEASPKTTANVRELPKVMEEPKTTSASMTIFYAGKVFVFNEFPEDKAEEIMALASKGIAKSTHPRPQIQTQTQTETQTQIPNSSSNNSLTTQHNHDTASQELGGPSDLPIARRTSLFKFMEKRKDRIASTAPYQLHNPSLGIENSNPHRFNVVMRNLCEQQKVEQQQQLDLKL